MNQAEEYRPPVWLTEALDGSVVSNQFFRRCREAADAALALALLTAEREKIGFVPLSFADYLKGVARVLGVHLDPVLAWARIADASRVDSATVSGFARLWRELGFSARETLAQLKTSFAERVEGVPLALLAAQRRTGGMHHSALDECESVVGQLEGQWDGGTMSELRQMEAQVRVAFEVRE
ncbi:MAG: hypothetical protein ABSH47_23035 [Bryobacteraceae bacterium]|jgi:hypothetical protein